MRSGAEEAYRKHGRSLHGFLLHSGADPDMAEDILHDAFRRFMERPPRPGNTRAWLYKVAINRLNELRRRAGRHALAVAKLPEGEATADPAPSPDDGVLRLEARQTARRVLESVSPRERQILLMRLDGFTHREIAEAVGTTTGSIGTMVGRALRKVAAATQYQEARP